MQNYEPPEDARRGPERRGAERLDQVPLEARGASGGRIHDISRTGVALETERALEPGTVLDLELVDRPTGLSCPFRARVVWCGGGRAGMQFVEVTPEQDGWLAARFVEWLTAAAGF